MNDYFGEARKLGEQLLASEEAKALADANAAFDEDKDAVEKMDAFTTFQTEVQDQIRKNGLSKEEMQEISGKMANMSEELQKIPVVAAVVSAERAYQQLINQTLEITRATAMGQPAAAGCGGCGNGSGCGGCG